MATFEMTGPDGGTYQIDAPDQQSALAAFSAFYGAPTTQGAAPTQPTNAPDIGENRMSTIAALRGIPVLGGYADKAVAALNAAAQPLTETGLSHAGSFSERLAANERKIKGAVDQYETSHPVGTAVGKIALGTAAMLPLGETALGARALGLVGESLPAQIAAGAASGSAIGAADAATRGEDVLGGAEKGAAFGGAGPVAGRVIGKVAQGARDLVTGQPASATIPTTDQLKGAASAGYDAIKNMDV